jgi:hypothetical protein
MKEFPCFDIYSYKYNKKAGILQYKKAPNKSHEFKVNLSRAIIKQ